jgi:polyphenol oxidase
MMIVTSALLSARGSRHGFSTRRGGVSEGRYATLNVGGKWGDEPERVEHNRKRLAAAGGFDLSKLYTATQVHGARVAVVVDGVLRDRVAATEADALVSLVPGSAVGVYTADCVPILFDDGDGRVAAAHAGWRGTVAGIAAATVEAMVATGARREHIRAALGPSICIRCFEVGEEVAATFDRIAPESVRRTEGRKPHVDLWLANRALLLSAGLSAEHVDATPPCTSCERERFFSFRRDGAGIGQHLSFIVAS